MKGLFDEREHAAESIFAHDEELRFLAHRRAIQALGAWAAQCMALSPEETAAYGARLLDAFVAGTMEDRIIAQVQTDLERAGKPALSTTAPTMLAQAVAQATDELHGRVTPRPIGQLAAEHPHHHAISASLGWLD